MDLKEESPSSSYCINCIHKDLEACNIYKLAINDCALVSLRGNKECPHKVERK